MTNRLIDRWMWTRAFDMLSEMERRSRRFFDLATQTANYAWQAPVDVFESNGELLVYVALPGVADENIEVLLEQEVLRIRARRTINLDPTTAIHQLEIPYGWLERAIVLPAPNYQVTQQSLTNGCLFLRLRHE